MIDCVEECSVLKFQHGPLLRFSDVSTKCSQSGGCYATYFHAADTLFYISEKGIRGIVLKKNVFQAIGLSSDYEEYTERPSKPEVLHNFSSDRTEDYTDAILKNFSLNCIKINEAETYVAFVIDPKTRSEDDPHIIICELHQNKPFFQNHVEVYLEMENNTNDQGFLEKFDVITIQWAYSDELLVLTSTGFLYLVCINLPTKPPLNGPSLSAQSSVFIFRFPKKITCFSTSKQQSKTYDVPESCSGSSFSQQGLSSNILLACATTPDQIFALRVASNDNRAQNGILHWQDALDVCVLQDTLTNVLNLEHPLDLSKSYIINCQCLSTNGLEWIFLICYSVDEEAINDSVLPDVLHVFVTLSCDLLRIEKCMGVVLNEIQVRINMKNIMSSLRHLKTSIVYGEDICSYFLSSTCAPDIALVTSSSSLVKDSEFPYIIVKPPETFQLCCEQVDFETPVGCVDIIYIPKYPLNVPLTHVTLDTPPLENPSLVLLLQSDNVISCHYLDTQLAKVSTHQLEKVECENDTPQCIKPLNQFFTESTTSHGRLVFAAQKTCTSSLGKPSNISLPLKNPCVKDHALKEIDAVLPANMDKAANKIEKDIKVEKQRTVEQYIAEIESFKKDLNANKEINKVLADGLRAYECEVKDLEQEMKLGVPLNIEECVENCKNQLNIQKKSLERVEQTLQEFQCGPVSTLEDLFEEIMFSRGLMSSYHKVFCDALEMLKNLISVRQNKTIFFSCNATAYRSTVEECLKYLTLLQHTGNTQLSLVRSAQNEPNNLPHIALPTDSLKYMQRIKNLFYSVLSLLDMISIRSENFENTVDDLNYINKEQEARYDHSGRRYALDYSVLDTLNAPEKLTDTLITTPSPVGLQTSTALLNFHTKTLEQVTCINQRLRMLQFKSRQLNYEFLSFGTLQGTEVNRAEPREESTWKFIPHFPLESTINNLLKQERYCEKNNALLLFESTREELQVSKQFLNLVTGQKKQSNVLTNNFACRQEYFDYLEEEINGLQKRQTHVKSTNDQLKTSFLQLLDGIDSSSFKSVLKSSGALLPNKLCENENLCSHVKTKEVNHFNNMAASGEGTFKISEPPSSLEQSAVNASDRHTATVKDPSVSVTQVFTTTHMNQQVSCGDSTKEPNIENENTNSFVSCKDSFMPDAMKSEKTSPAVSQETFPFVEGTKKNMVSDLNDESSMKTFSGVGQKKTNEDPIVEKTDTCIFNETKNSNNVGLTSLTFGNPFTTPFTNCLPSSNIMSPVIETAKTNHVNRKSEETELSSGQSIPMQLDAQTKSYSDGTFQNNGGALKLDSVPVSESSAFERKQYSFGLDPVIPTRPSYVEERNDKKSSWAEGLIKNVPSQKVSFFNQACSGTNSTNSFPIMNDAFTLKNANEPVSNNTLMGNQNSSTFGVFGATRFTPTDTISFGGFGALQTPVKDTSLFGGFTAPQSTSKDTPTFGSFPLTSVNPPNPFPSPSSAFGKPLPLNTASTSNTDLKNLFSSPSVVDVGSYRIPDTMN